MAPPTALRVFRDLVRRAGIGRGDTMRLLDLAAEARGMPEADALTEEQLQRIHALLDITNSLRVARDQETARVWLTVKDRGALQGYSPVQHMIRNGPTGFAEVQRLAHAFANE